MEQLLTELILTKENALVMGGVFALLTAIKKVFPKLNSNGFYKRALPVLPEALCVGLLLLPGIRPEGRTVTELVLVGLMLGVASSKFHKVLKQTFLGDDADIKQAKLDSLEKKAVK